MVFARPAALILAGLLLASCGGDEPAAPPAPTATAATAALDGCIEPGGSATIKGDVATFGSGPAGVVTVSGPGGDACQWIELAEALAARGHRVLVPASGAGDDADEVRANLALLPGDAALISTSAGAVAVLEAADDAARLVTLSAVRRVRGTDALELARELDLPMLHLGSREDPDTNRGRDTRQLRPTGEAVIVDGDAHGTDLLVDHPALIARIARFLGP